MVVVEVEAPPCHCGAGEDDQGVGSPSESGVRCGAVKAAAEVEETDWNWVAEIEVAAMAGVTAPGC